MTRLLFCALTFCVCCEAEAGGYRYGYYQQYVQPLYQTFYYVGAPIRAAAIVEAEKRSDPDYQEFLDFKTFRSEWGAFKAWKESQTAVPEGALPQQQSQLQASCVRCHSGPERKGEMDFSGPIDASTLKAITRVIREGTMPKDGSPEAKDFTPDKAGQVVADAIESLSE